MKILNCHLRVHSACVFIEHILLSFTWVRRANAYRGWLAKWCCYCCGAENYEWVGTKSVMPGVEPSTRMKLHFILCMSDRSTVDIMVNNICWNYCTFDCPMPFIGHRSAEDAASGDANASINVIHICYIGIDTVSPLANKQFMIIIRFAVIWSFR